MIEAGDFMEFIIGFLEFINNIIITIFMFFIGGISGVIYGIFKGINVYFVTIYKYIKKQKTKNHVLGKGEPAFEKYFFYRQYNDLGNIFVGAINMIFQDLALKKLIKRDSKYYIVNCFKNFFRVGTKIVELIVGSFSIIIFSSLHLFIVTIISIPVYILFIIVYVFEKYYLWKGEIFTICPNCFSKFKKPYYLCPQCGCVHKNLVPGAYGIFKRKCLCGQKISVVHFMKRNLIKCQCPHCDEILACRDSSPFCVSIIGGEDAGKTSFIYGGINAFMGEMQKKNWNISFSNSIEEEKLKKALLNYNNGINFEENKNINITNFFVDSSKFSSKKAVYIFDEPGENFKAKNFFRNRKYFEYIDGLIILIDPLSFKEAYNFNKSSMDNTSDFLDVSILNLKKIYDLRVEQLIDIPTAIVINKVDLFDKSSDSKEFLKEKGEENLIRKIEYNFSNYKIFSSSALGHTPNEMPFKAQGVKEPIEWILGTFK